MNAKPLQMCFTLNDTEIPYSDNVKYLGVSIDPQLNFKLIQELLNEQFLYLLALFQN